MEEFINNILQKAAELLMDSIAGTFSNREVKILCCAPSPQSGGDKRLILQTANSDCKLLEILSAGKAHMSLAFTFPHG